MIISSRTPEGSPFHCPICNAVSALEPSYPGEDAVCPKCGNLLWLVHNALSRQIKNEHPAFSLATKLKDLDLDSLDIAELGMEIEEEYGIKLPVELGQVGTLGELLRLIERLKSNCT